MASIKAILGVRSTTTNDLCINEIGYPTLASFVKQQQKNFFNRIIENRRDNEDDPLMYVMGIVQRRNTPAWKYIRQILDNDNSILKDIEKTKERIIATDSSKYITYLYHNPDLSVPEMYKQYIVPEYQRIVYSRFRLSSHNLKIETGRWSRIQRENRTCACTHGGVQDEEHVIMCCTKLNELRARYPNTNFNIPSFHTDNIQAAQFVYQATKCYQ